MFDDRTNQFEKFRLALAGIERIRAAVTDMWATGRTPRCT
jgi:hypothetical protein